MYRFTTATKKLLGDLHTPVSLYLKLRDVYPQSALLESSDYHGGENSLSFIAFRPVARIGVNNGEALLEYPDGRSVAKPLGETYAAADALKEFLNEFRVDGDGSEFCGLFGYTAFDAVRYFENIPVREFHHRDSDAPDICYILYKFLLVFDHFKNELSIVELCADGERDHIREVETLIEDRNFASYNFRTVGERRSNLTDETYREMVRQGSGVILNMSSESGLEGSEGQSVYAASKNAVNSLTRSWAKELGKKGVRVVGVAPGILEATGLRTLAYETALAYTRGITIEQLREGYAKTSTTPLGRSGKLTEVANTVAFLLSDRASYIHGVTINVAGGKTRG